MHFTYLPQRSLVTALLVSVLALPVHAQLPAKAEDKAAEKKPEKADDSARDAELFGDDEGATPAAAKPNSPGVVQGKQKELPATKVAKPKKNADAAGEAGEDIPAEEMGDERLTGDAEENTALLTRDKTQIGGFFYARNFVAYGEGQKFSDISLSNTTLFDVYFDSRVNDRVRAYARGRLIYNPNADLPGAPLLPGLSPQPASDEIHSALPQMWLKFDIYRNVYVTVGRQFVRWGTSRFWNPIDVLNTTKYNPFLFFDERVGIPMVKIHVPVESLGWNFYGIILNDNVTTVDRLGVAGRGEFVVGPVEIGLTGMVKRGVDPKLGLDWSAGVGAFDITGELGAVLAGGGPLLQVTAGASWSWAYREDDNLTLGCEYFHNPQGYTFDQIKSEYSATATAYGQAYAAHLVDPSQPAPTLNLPQHTPLYTGRDYAGLLAAVISPGSFSDAAITMLVLSNLTDKSGTIQLNVSNRFLTDLTVETYVAGSLGDGELRGYLPYIKSELLPGMLGSQSAAFSDGIHAPLLRIGLNLRVDL